MIERTNNVFKISIVILFFVIFYSSTALSQIKMADIYKCADPFLDSCVILRNFTAYGGSKVNNWEVDLIEGNIYLFQLCGGKKFERKAPNTILCIYEYKENAGWELVKELTLGGFFELYCCKSNKYMLKFKLGGSASHSGVVAILYFKDKFEP